MQDLINQWTKSGFLDGLEPIDQWHLAVLLDNQSKYNDFKMANIDESIVQSFKKIALPLTYRLYNSLTIKNLISYSPISPQITRVQYRDLSNRMTNFEANPGTEWFSNFGNYGYGTDLKSNVEKAEEINEITLRFINREILGELLMAKTVEHEWINAKHLFDMFLVASSQIERKIGRQANWIVVSPAIFQELKNLPEFVAIDEEPSKLLYLAGKLFNRWDLYVEPTMENEDILLGHKSNDPTCMGYFFSIFIPFMLQGSRDLPMLGMRRMNRIINFDYYSTIKLINYSDMLEEFDFIEIMQEYARR